MLRVSSLMLRLVLVAAILGLAGCPLFTRDPDKPEANIQADVTEGFVPLTVRFTDASLPGSGAIYAWFWNFGDGNVANKPNPQHTYTAPGVYDVQLTVQTAYGSDTIILENRVTVYARSTFALIGPEGGTVNAGPAIVSVPANALQSDTGVGITLQDAPFLVNAPEPVFILSDAFEISHDSEDGGFAAPQPDGTLAPATITFTFLSGAVPPEHRNGDKIHLLAQLEDGLSFPLFGQVTGDTLVVPVAALPSKATFGVVYRPDSYAQTLDFSEGKVLTSQTWQPQWRLRLSPLMLQQLTALRLGDIDHTDLYSRADFTQAETNATLNAIEEYLEETATRFEGNGLRSPALVSPNGVYELVLYNFAGLYVTDYERFADLTPTTRQFGVLGLDPRQLINVSLHNAANLAENPDGAQELSLENALAEALYGAAFDGYDLPVIAAASPTDVDAEGNPLVISFAQPLLDGAGAYVGQLLDNFATARSFDAGETANLSDPLFSAFSNAAPGYATAAQDFFLFLANAFDIDPLAYLFASAEINRGLLERVRVVLASPPGTVSFDRAQRELRLTADEVMNAFFSQSLPALYWFFARERAVEGSVLARLRPSDAEREPFTLQEDRLDEAHVVAAAFDEGGSLLSVDAATEPALRDIPPLSSRAVLVEVDPETRDLTFTFNREQWAEDERGNSVAVKVYPEGEDGVELEQASSSLILNPYSPPCPLPDDPVLLVTLLWPAFDLDGDGGLSLAEIRVLDPTVSDIAFALADTNGDNLLSLQEVLTVLPTLSIDPLGLLDANGDGFLELAEFGGALSAEQFALLDLNGNGYFDCGDLQDFDKQDEPAGPGHVIVLISNLNLAAANSIYMSVARPE